MIIMTISVGLQNLTSSIFLTFNPTGRPIHFILFLFGFYALIAIFFNMSITNIIIKNEKKRKIVMIFTIIIISILILLYYTLYIISFNHNFISLYIYGSFYTIFVSIFLIISLIIFCRQLLNSDLPIDRLKGRFQLLCIIFFILYNLILLSQITQLFFLAIVFSGLAIIFLYIGIVLPPRIAKGLIKNWSEENVEFIPDHIDNIQDFLKMLQSKPKTITIEEITYFREQKLCLVCKGEIGEMEYLCDCGALYCTKCTFALIEIENICWACENALDKTKPVKIAEWIVDNVVHSLPEDNEQVQKKKKNE